jgi:hypothetical protein
LKVNPVVLGSGIGIFRGGTRPRPLELLDSTTYRSGVVLLQYRRAPDAPEEGK